MKRKRHLTILVHFMKEATQELLWMSEKEENEVSRDWSDNDLDLSEIEDYRKVSVSPNTPCIDLAFLLQSWSESCETTFW